MVTVYDWFGSPKTTLALASTSAPFQTHRFVPISKDEKYGLPCCKTLITKLFTVSCVGTSCQTAHTYTV